MIWIPIILFAIEKLPNEALSNIDRIQNANKFWKEVLSYQEDQI